MSSSSKPIRATNEDNRGAAQTTTEDKGRASRSKSPRAEDPERPPSTPGRSPIKSSEKQQPVKGRTSENSEARIRFSEPTKTDRRSSQGDGKSRHSSSSSSPPPPPPKKNRHDPLKDPQIIPSGILKHRPKSNETPVKKESTDERRSSDGSGGGGGASPSAEASDEFALPNLSTRSSDEHLFPASGFISWRVDRPVRLQMAKEGALAEKPTTIMAILKELAARYKAKMAVAALVRSKWTDVSYENLLVDILRAARSFIKLGLQRFYGVGILADNSIEFVIAHYGAIFAGGISCPMYSSSAPEFLFHLLKDARCQILVVDSIQVREQVFEWRQRLPKFHAIVQIDVETFRKAESVYPWNEFLEMGKEIVDEVLHYRTLQQAPNMCCCIAQTAGTCGAPKNVLLSHDNLVWSANSLAKAILSSSEDESAAAATAATATAATAATAEATASVFCFYPMGSPAMLSASLATLFKGISMRYVNITKDKTVLLKLVKDIRPTLIFGHAKLYEHLQLEIEANFRKTLSGRILFNWARNVGKKRIIRDTYFTTSYPACWSVANNVVFKKIRTNLGLDRCSGFYAGGYPMMGSTVRFFLSIDMPIQTVYCLAETTGINCLERMEKYMLGSAGFPLDGCSVTIRNPDSSGVGTVHIAGRNVAMGYLDSEEVTKLSFHESDGTLQTTDLGRTEDGCVFVIGNKCDIITLSTGDKIVTGPLQLTIRTRLPFVSYAFIVGEGEPYLSAILTAKMEIDSETHKQTNRLEPEAIKWFRMNGLDIEYSSDIIAKGGAKLTKKVQTIFNAINADAPHESYRIKRWVILQDEFTTHAGEIGPTLKMKRWFLKQKYSSAIKSLYSTTDDDRKSVDRTRL